MKKQLLAGGELLLATAIATAVAFAPLASAQDVPTVPTCSQAIATQADQQRQLDAATADDKAATDAQKLYDTLDAARVELAAAVKADNSTVPPLAQDSQRTKDAKAAVVAAQVAVSAFEAKGVTIETLRKKAADTDAAAIKVKLDAAGAATDKACKGDPGTVTTTPAVPTTTAPPAAVVIPNAINTGRA